MRIAFDPGQTTGVAWREPTTYLEDTTFGDPEPHFLEFAGDLRATQWPGESIIVVLDGFNARDTITEVVVESFISRPGPAVNLSAPETIGRIRAWCEARGIDPIMQTPSAAKTVVTNDRLRAMGGWKSGEKHSRDALRHLLLREHTLGIIDLKEIPKGS